MLFLYIEFLIYEYFYILLFTLLSFVSIIAYIISLKVLSIKKKNKNIFRGLKIKRPFSPTELFFELNKEQIIRLAPTMDERNQLNGELKGSLTSISIFYDIDSELLTVPIKDIMEDLSKGRSEYAENVYRNFMEAGLNAKLSEDADYNERMEHEQTLEYGGSAARNLAAFSLLKDDIDKAMDLYDKSVRLRSKDSSYWRRNGDAKMLYGSMGDAQHAYSKALELSDARNEIHQKAGALLGLGIILMRKGQYDDAIEYLQSAAEISINIKRNDLRGKCKYYLGEISFQLNQNTEAQSFYEEALILARVNGNIDSVAQAYEGLSRIAIKKKSYRTAEGYLLSGYDSLQKALAPPLPMVDTLTALSMLYLRQNDLELARDFLLEAKVHAKKIVKRKYLMKFYLTSGIISVKCKDFREAEYSFNLGLYYSHNLDRDPEKYRFIWELAMFYSDQKRYLDAINYAKKCLKFYLDIQEKKQVRKIRTWIANVYYLSKLQS